MIVVIADDLSGAAELAGAAFNRGLRAEVQTAFTPETGADVICVDTDTRPLSPDEGARTVGAIARTIAAAKPAWIYKKCDSVLRGNVLAEILAILPATALRCAVLISANPSRGRVIRGGRYFIDGQPLDKTVFARDPGHPRHSARITELLGNEVAEVKTPDAACTDDLIRHARALESDVLPAGGLEFFEAVLQCRAPSLRARDAHEPAADVPEGPTLFLCGSAAAWTVRRAEFVSRRIPLITLSHTPDVAALAERTCHALASAPTVMLAVGRPFESHREPQWFANRLVHAAELILRRVAVGRVLVEGGATAAAFVRRMGWSRFAVNRRAPAGVGALQVIGAGAPWILVKPGSYPWPEEIWRSPR